MKAFPFLEALLLVVLFTTCKKDSVVVPKDYPYVITNMPAANPEGAIFSANLVSSGKQKILRYGFVWSEKDKPELTDDHKIFEGSIAEGAYSFRFKISSRRRENLHGPGVHPNRKLRNFWQFCFV